LKISHLRQRFLAEIGKIPLGEEKVKFVVEIQILGLIFEIQNFTIIVFFWGDYRVLPGCLRRLKSEVRGRGERPQSANPPARDFH